MSKYKVALVSYLNSKPFLYGLKNYSFKSSIEYSVDTPSNIAKQLLNNEVDLALVPVAVIAQLKEYSLLNGFCIGADGPVQSVCLFSDQPIEKCKKILLDYQSRTSVILTRILIQKHWVLFPQFVSATEGFEKNIKDETAGLVIGDRALLMKNKFRYAYDLSAEWKKFTGLPFVFAAWISKNKIPNEIQIELTSTFEMGLGSIEKVIAEEENNFRGINVKEYLTKNIKFILDEEKLKAMNLFLVYLKETEMIWPLEILN